MAMLVTPAMAQEWLDNSNIGNRRLRAWWAIALAAAMTRGEWILTHQGIAFDQNGRLIDGQHRLRAIIASGQPCMMFVFTGLDPRAFMAIDTGVKRSTADTTGLETGAAEVCKNLAGLTFPGGNTAATAQQVRIIANAGVEEIHARLMEFCSTRKKIFSAAPIRVAAILLVMDGYPEEKVFTMYRNVVLKRFEDLPPVGLTFIRQADSGKIYTHGSKNDLLARALKVLNPNNSSLTRIQISESDASAAAAYARNVLVRVMSDKAFGEL